MPVYLVTISIECICKRLSVANNFLVVISNLYYRIDILEMIKNSRETSRKNLVKRLNREAAKLASVKVVTTPEGLSSRLNYRKTPSVMRRRMFESKSPIQDKNDDNSARPEGQKNMTQ